MQPNISELNKMWLVEKHRGIVCKLDSAQCQKIKTNESCSKHKILLLSGKYTPTPQILLHLLGMGINNKKKKHTHSKLAFCKSVASLHVSSSWLWLSVCLAPISAQRHAVRPDLWSRVAAKLSLLPLYVLDQHVKRAQCHAAPPEVKFDFGIELRGTDRKDNDIQ